MRRKIFVAVMGTSLITFGTGASCRQETAQAVLATFLNTLAETAAQELVKTVPQPLNVTEATFRAGEADR